MDDTAHSAPEVAPVEVDGTRAVIAGTVAWAIALVALLPFTGELRDEGRLWWIATCACGVALGLAGILYLRRRRESLKDRAPVR